jgi:hypothetical protein
MATGTGRGANMSNALREAVAPVRERLEVLEREIAGHEARLKDLRDERTKARRIMEIIDPPPAKKGTSRAQNRPAAERMDAVIAFAKKLYDGEPFSAPKLRKLDGYEEQVGLSESYLSKVLGDLHEQGRIRLTEIGKSREKFFVLTEAPTVGRPDGP